MTTVPNRSAATVSQTKIQAFLLDESHTGNKGRAKFFALFGFTSTGWETMRDALPARVAANPIVETETTMHGTNDTVRCSMPSPDGRNPCISSIWTIEPGGEPRFVTAFPGPPPRLIC
nr:DUF6883 domain-containing protein [uncultured Rhodopila sp.]